MPLSVIPLLAWDKSYETGVPEIDEQHKILVETLNEASLTLAKENSVKQLEQITQNLLSYALYHFDTEEELIKNYAYQDESEEEAKHHLAEHRYFTEKVVSIRDTINTEKGIEASDLLQFLKEWLLNHILKTDKKLGEFIVSQKNLHD